MLNLATGSTTTLGQAGVPKAPLDDQGSYSDPSWSPNSRQIVVDYQTDWNKLLVIPVAHLTRSSSTKIHSPEGCSYSAPLWTDTGILAAEACGRSPSSRTSPSELVEVSATGTARRTWALPACTLPTPRTPNRTSSGQHLHRLRQRSLLRSPNRPAIGTHPNRAPNHHQPSRALRTHSSPSTIRNRTGVLIRTAEAIEEHSVERTSNRTTRAPAGRQVVTQTEPSLGSARSPTSRPAQIAGRSTSTPEPSRFSDRGGSGSSRNGLHWEANERTTGSCSPVRRARRPTLTSSARPSTAWSLAPAFQPSVFMTSATSTSFPRRPAPSCTCASSPAQSATTRPPSCAPPRLPEQYPADCSARPGPLNDAFGHAKSWRPMGQRADACRLIR
jgi:hypothetical protein